MFGWVRFEEEPSNWGIAWSEFNVLLFIKLDSTKVILKELDLSTLLGVIKSEVCVDTGG